MTTIEVTTTNKNGINVNTINIHTIDLNATDAKVDKKTKKKKKNTIYIKGPGHKMHVCIFCKKEFPRLAEHFMRRHRNEDKVKDIIATTDKKAKMWKWKTLRQQGDHFFNVMGNLGERKLVKVPTRPSKDNKYFNCPICYARLRTCSRFEHSLVCRKVFKVDGDTNLGEINEDIFVRMPESLINKIRKSSYLNDFLKQKYEAGENKNFRILCKDMIHLEEEIQKTTGQDKPLSCFLISAHVDDFIKILKDMGGQMECAKERGVTRYPFRIQRFYRMIVHFCRYLTGYYSKRNLDKDLAEVTKFLNAFRIDSDTVLHRQVRRAIKIKQLLTPKSIPKTSDIKLLVRKLKEETPKLMKELREKSDRRTWRSLAENVLCRLTIFNRRRGGAVERMKLSDYTRTEVKFKALTEESMHGLSNDDIAFLKNLRVVRILHKCDNSIPIYITKELQEPMDMLLEYRKYADDIHEKNDYFFAAGKNSLTSIRGVKVLERYREILPEKTKKYFTATTLRKHGATVAQVLDLSLQDKEEWAEHMGHSVQVHNKYYKMAEEVSAILRTGRILTALNEGAIKYYKGKKISEIPLKTDKSTIKASVSKTSDEKTVFIKQGEDHENEAENPKSTSAPSGNDPRSGADSPPPIITQPTDKGSTSQADGTTPVTILLVSSTPLPDKSGRSYVNMIPVTIAPSLNKEGGTSPDQISVTTSSFSDADPRSYANVIPVTSTPSLDKEAKSHTYQTAVPTIVCPDQNPGFFTDETYPTTTSSLGVGPKSYTHEIVVPTSLPSGENARSDTDETRVSILLKCTTPFRDQNGRSYVNLIPVTIILSPTKAARSDANETPATDTQFPDAHARSYTNVIPATTTPHDLGSRSYTHKVTSSYSDEAVVQTADNSRSYRNETVYIPTAHIPDKNERFYTYESSVPKTSFTHEHTSFYKNDIGVQTTPPPHANRRFYLDETVVETDESSRCYRNEIVFPSAYFPRENPRSSIYGTPFRTIAAPSPDTSSTSRADMAPGAIVFCTKPSPDNNGEYYPNLTPVTIKSSINEEARTYPDLMTVPTISSPVQVAKLHERRSSVIVSTSHSKGVRAFTDKPPIKDTLSSDQSSYENVLPATSSPSQTKSVRFCMDETPNTNTPSSSYKNSKSYENELPAIASPSRGREEARSYTDKTGHQTTTILEENGNSFEDEIPVPTTASPKESIIPDGTSLPKENATSHAIGIPVIVTPSPDKVAKSKVKVSAQTPATTVPILEENVQSRANEIPSIAPPSPSSPQKGATSNEVETPATAPTSPDRIPTTTTTTTVTPSNSCNGINTEHEITTPIHETEESIDSDRRQTAKRKEMTWSSESHYYDDDDDRKRKRRNEDLEEQGTLVYEGGYDSPKEDSQLLPVKKRLFQRYCSKNESDGCSESHPKAIKEKSRKKRKRKSNKRKRSAVSQTTTKKASTTKTYEPVKLTLKLTQRNKDEDIFSDCSSNNSSDSSAFF